MLKAMPFSLAEQKVEKREWHGVNEQLFKWKPFNDAEDESTTLGLGVAMAGLLLMPTISTTYSQQPQHAALRHISTFNSSLPFH